MTKIKEARKIVDWGNGGGNGNQNNMLSNLYHNPSLDLSPQNTINILALQLLNSVKANDQLVFSPW